MSDPQEREGEPQGMPEPKQSIAAAHPIHGRASASEAQLQKPRGPQHTSTTQGTPHPRTTHADTYTCWRGRACKRMCVQSERTSACRSWHHLTKTCAWEVRGAQDWYLQPPSQKRGQLHRDDLVPAVSLTLRVVRNCTASNNSSHNTSANKGKESRTHAPELGSPPPQTAMRQLLTEGRDIAETTVKRCKCSVRA